MIDQHDESMTPRNAEDDLSPAAPTGAGPMDVAPAAAESAVPADEAAAQSAAAWSAHGEADVSAAAEEMPSEMIAAEEVEDLAGASGAQAAEQGVGHGLVEEGVEDAADAEAAGSDADDDGPAMIALPAAPRAEKPAPKRRRKKSIDDDLPTSTLPKSENMSWYILKVQSNREESIREGLLRRVRIAGLDHFVGDVIVPTEKVTEFKGGKKRVLKRKLYPGYLVVHMEINDDTWFLVRETPGIGDFTGAAGRPSPMLDHEIARILAKQEEKSEKAPKLKIAFKPGDQVKINEGTFENFEGEVSSIDQTNGRVTVMINIFGRSTPVELEYWQVGAV